MHDKDYFKAYMSDARWQIYENGWSPEKQSFYEALFTIGNGYICSRGVLDEAPKGSHSGTYFAGIFDRIVSSVPELVNAPNPFALKIKLKNESFDLNTMAIQDHRRILDMYHASLSRRTIFLNKNNKRFSFQSLRFISNADPHLAALRTTFTPLDGPATITVDTALDSSVINKALIDEKPKRGFKISESVNQKSTDYLAVTTLTKKECLAFGSMVQIHYKGRTYFESKRSLKFTLKKGETLYLTKTIALQTSRDTTDSQIKQVLLKKIQAAAGKGFDTLFSEHCQAWSTLWKQAKLSIIGAPDLERALLYNAFQLLIVGNQYSDDTGIGAKTLSGEGYRGHSFWDTEIFTLPYFTFNFPEIARNLLTYRYKRLDQARLNARNNNLNGAMFPWESADTGEEATPPWHKDFDGTLKKITTGLHELHITADIAYGLVQYYLVTDDTKFMLTQGLEMLLETARFWASRVELNKAKAYYEINNVIGPDEFHEEIDNSAYTNMMAAWNLKTAAKLIKTMEADYPRQVAKVIKKIALTKSEPKHWITIANKVKTNCKNDIIEEFDGYFRKKYLPLPQLDDYFIPGLPDMPSKEYETTQYVKQADIVMLLYLLYTNFSKQEVVKNFHFYEQRTLHKSSLSPAMHALVAARIGDQTKALRYLRASAYTDLNDIHHNTGAGIHAASLGGTWQAAVIGFGGVTIHNGMLKIDPVLPKEWPKMEFRIVFHGHPIGIIITHETIDLVWYAPSKNKPLNIQIHGRIYKLTPGRTKSIKSSGPNMIK